jgi:FtsP/CotA-like multicopper oxidase with cupredoxin domain
VKISRRAALQTVATIAGSAYLAACGRGDRSSSVPTAPDNSDQGAQRSAFLEPDELRSVGGRLQVSLTAAAATFPNAVSGALAYNGAPIGPTLRLRPGDRLTVELTNRLDVATNLHTHGLGVSPTSPADDVFARVAPSETRRYDYQLPTDHPSGLFWYHPHQHGDVARQVGAGLVGAVIVDDEIDELSELSSARERLWVLNDPSAADQTPTGMDQMHGRAGRKILVNGVSQPNLDATVGQAERWRIVNASASRMMPFAVDGLPLNLIATDGGRLDAPIEVNGLVLAPGERAEVLVIPTSEPAARTVSGDGPLVTVVVADPHPSSASTPGSPQRLRDSASFDIGPVTTRRTLRLGADMSGGMMSQDSALVFTIDGRTFDPERVDIETTLGEVEEWTIVNETGMDHPFHLHVWPIQVVDDRGWPGWKDTVNVPGGQQVTIRIPFVGHAGRTVYHCHILDHEDIGMMGVIEVTAAPSDDGASEPTLTP